MQILSIVYLQLTTKSYAIAAIAFHAPGRIARGRVQILSLLSSHLTTESYAFAPIASSATAKLCVNDADCTDRIFLLQRTNRMHLRPNHIILYQIQWDANVFTCSDQPEHFKIAQEEELNLCPHRSHIESQVSEPQLTCLDLPRLV